MDWKLIPKILEKIPVIDLIPVVYGAWASMSEEKKKEVATNLILAASKAAAEYASK